MIRQLVGHSAAYTFANLLSRGTVLIWLIVLPRFLSAADYGALGLIITTAAIVGVVIPLEVSQGLARYYAGAPSADRKSWASTAWTFSTVMLAAAAAIALPLAPTLSRLLFGTPSYVSEFRLALAYFLLGASFLFLQSQFRWAFRTRDYAIVTAVFAFVTLAASIGLAVVLPNPLWGVLLGLVIGAGAGVALGMFMLRDTVTFMIDRAKLVRMLRFSLPIVPASLSVLVSTYASRFILNDLLALKDVGLFTWASQLANVPATLLLGIQAAVTPLVMKHHAEPQTPGRLARSFETVTVAALIVAAAIGLFTPEFIRTLGYTSYAPAAPLVLILGPAYMLLQLYVFFPGFAIGERTSHQLLVSIASASATLALNYLLIARVGLVGAALATLGSTFVFLALWVGLSNRHYPVPVRWLRVALFAAAIALCDVAGRALADASLVVAAVLKIGMLLTLCAVAMALGLIGINKLRMLRHPDGATRPVG